jgi:transcriptional regulator with XRE-family HTH domain
VSNDSQSPLGPFIRQQREMQDLSLRRLAKLVGISNPYLSQIERGPRDPSQRVLDAIARNLEISAEALDEHAGFAADGTRADGEEWPVVAAVRADARLTASQRRALLAVYDAFTERPRGRRRRA